MTKFVGALTILVLLASTDCGAGEIAREYRLLRANPAESSFGKSAAVGLDSIGCEIVRFGVEQDGMISYSLLVDANGKCEFNGYQGLMVVYRRGDPCSAGPQKYTGWISQIAFKQVVQFVLEEGFFALDDAYDIDVTDAASTYTLVETSSGKKIVKNSGNAGPAELVAIERMIRGLVFEVAWGP